MCSVDSCYLSAIPVKLRLQLSRLPTRDFAYTCVSLHTLIRITYMYYTYYSIKWISLYLPATSGSFSTHIEAPFYATVYIIRILLTTYSKNIRLFTAKNPC